MNVLGVILGALAIAAGATATVLLLVLCVSAAPNSDANQSRNLRLFAIAVASLGLVCVVGGLVLCFAGLAFWGALLGAVPLVPLIGSIAWSVASTS